MVQIVDVLFTNPFPEDCLFIVSVIDSASESEKAKGGLVHRGSNLKSAEGNTTTSWSGLPNRAFWLRAGRDKAKAQRGQQGSVQLNFMPFRLGTQVTTIP
jgi:hypothetical protein